MKSLFTLFLCLLLSILCHAQPWLKNLPQHKTARELTFFDYKNAFDTYWAPYNVKNGYYSENGVQKKAAGWKQFKRWEYEMESQIHPTTGEFSGKSVLEIEREFNQKNPS